MEVISSLFCLLGVILSQAIRFTYLTMLLFVCLNGILVSVFLLRMLFFKPKFVENRQQTFTVVDPGGQIQTGTGVGGSATESLQGGLDGVDMVVKNGTPTANNNSHILEQLGAELPTTRSMMSRKIEQLYNTETFADAAVEYLTPYNPTQPIKFAEKLGAGFVGMIFKLQASEKDKTLPAAPAKCAKLVDVRTLLHILEELNYVQGTLSARMRLTALFRTSTVGGSFMMKYLNAYHRFLDSAKQLETVPQGSPATTADGTDGNNTSRSPRQHPNVHYYEQVLVYHDPDRVASNRPRSAGSGGTKGGLFGPTGLPLPTSLTSTTPVGETPKTFKRVSQVERQQLPALVMLVMEQARLNLRSMLIYEWYSVQTVPAAVEWGRQVGSGLAYLHAVLGFAHLNVKAENVLLFKNGRDGDSTLLPLHSRFTAKISDCATAFLLPTVSRVLSQSHETSLWEVSPPGADKFALSGHEVAQWYDVHCFSMLLLLMLVGYENYGRRYMLSMFPTGLLSGARYRLLEIIIEDAGSFYSGVELPEAFVALFKVVFSGEKNGKVTMKQLLAMDAFKAQS